ncbi:MAG: App1 family protein [Flavobacteriaceae bacterium]
MAFFGKKDQLQIINFQSYGTDTHLYVRGRALEDENIDLEQKGFFQLLFNSIKRFETDEVGNAKLRLTLPDGRMYYTHTDSEGYYKFDIQIHGLGKFANSEGWLAFDISFDDPQLNLKTNNANRFPGEILLPTAEAEFGVASDIDDTILHTGVVSWLKWQVVVNTFFKTAAKRIPLEGAAEFYHLLHRGGSGSNANPIFYVSHSPWNLYRYLDFFLRKNNFPKGPILLRSMSSFRNRKAEKPQKHHEILNILQTYPELKFILIGDSGEHDADIYLEIVETHPHRILAIYLRSVRHEKKMLRIRHLFKDYSRIPVLLVESSEQAIAHAKANRFI